MSWTVDIGDEFEPEFDALQVRDLIASMPATHANSAVSGKETETAIADVLLTPGTEYSAQGLVQALKTGAVLAALDLVGPEHTERLLQLLQTQPFREVRAAACVAMGELFRRWDCAGTLLGEFSMSLALTNSMLRHRRC